VNILEVNHLTMQFGGLVAVDDFNLNLEKGKIVGLIGPNGSGKTTVFNVITGFYKPTRGQLFLNGKEITGKRPDQITALGLARIFQNSRIFRNLTVYDNVMIGDHIRLKSTPAAAVLRTPGYVTEEKRANDLAVSLLEGLGLIQEVARALSTQPHVLLLDEPATGMSAEETTEMIDFILNVRKDFDLTILIIEHHMQVIMNICEQIAVLNYGKTIARGNPAEIQGNQEVIDAYLGAG